MRRLLVLSYILTISVPVVARADSPQVNAIRQQIAALRAEEKTTIQHIREHYKSILGNKKMDEREKESLRRSLHEQESLALSHTKDEEHRERIRGHYNHLRRVLSGEIRLDAGEIRRLHEHEEHHIRHVRAGYHAKLRELEEAIKAASHAQPPVKRKK